VKCGGSEHQISTVAHRGRSTPGAGWAERVVRLGVRLLERDATLVLGEPLVKSLQRGVEGPGDAGVARTAENFLEISLELEHVAEIIGARETEAAVHFWWHIVVPYLLPQCLGQRLSHLRTGQMFARNADGLTDKLPTLLEDAVGALVSSTAIPGSFLSPMGKVIASLPSGPFFGPMPK